MRAYIYLMALAKRISVVAAAADIRLFEQLRKILYVDRLLVEVAIDLLEGLILIRHSGALEEPEQISYRHQGARGRWKTGRESTIV